ncbi:hypothetical protein DUZ99_02445 [Xylanibacillus composti]|uniref:Prolipoprotein diacylglyceryl transferase n=1 Tax=Xylanibacillus composti TaxID=1572762 RepID=A0A8J4H0J6_9BACL|nr:hypothetical protein [Xylanibacillus composti]MDT9723855.1 hypothetical protein [Xylanibacillus composti]GIQ67366.1 hypothetical protein XYCOK13_01900 [Xylanibacillus composti]
MNGAVFQLGPLAINGQLLALLLAFLGFYLGLRLWLRSAEEEEAKQIDEWTWNAGAGAIIIWKFGELLLQPAILANGLTALIMPGSQRSAWLALGWVVIYLLWKWRRSRISAVLQALDAWLFAAVIGMAVYAGWSMELGRPTNAPIGWEPAGLSTGYHPIFLYQVVFGLAMAGVLFRWRGRSRGEVFGWGMAAAGAGSMIISFFAIQGSAHAVFVGLSYAQWKFAGMMLGGLFWIRIALPALKHNKSGKEMIVMSNNQSNNSKAQQEHERENKEQRDFTMGVDKKLSGPNRPAE